MRELACITRCGDTYWANHWKSYREPHGSAKVGWTPVKALTWYNGSGVRPGWSRVVKARSTLLRRESHYDKNDGKSNVMFCRSHFTFRTVTVAASLTWRECHRGNCCHGDNNGDGQGAGAKRSKAKWDSEAERKIIAIWADIPTSPVLCGSCADSDGNSEHILDSDSDSCTQGNGTRLWNGEKVDPQNMMSAIVSLRY